MSTKVVQDPSLWSAWWADRPQLRSALYCRTCSWIRTYFVCTFSLWPTCTSSGRSESSDQRAQARISFEEAETAFLDDFAIVLPHPDHSAADDERLLLIGLSAALRVLVVIHCEVDANVVRLISARRATRSERVQYDARWKR